jgi:hypothetical protein
MSLSGKERKADAEISRPCGQRLGVELRLTFSGHDHDGFVRGIRKS